jgi:hypothetical protein
MSRIGSGAEVPGQGRELVVGNLALRQHEPGEHGSVDDRARRPGDVAVRAGGRQEAEIEGRVVSDDDTAAGELDELRQHLANRGSVPDHIVADAGQLSDSRRDRMAGIDQSGELLSGPVAGQPDGADLGNARGVGEPACRLDVDDDHVSADDEPWGKVIGKLAHQAGPRSRTCLGQNPRFAVLTPAPAPQATRPERGDRSGRSQANAHDATVRPDYDTEPWCRAGSCPVCRTLTRTVEPNDALCSEEHSQRAIGTI